MVPTNPVARKFNDRLGLLIQEIDRITTHSWLVVQGRAIDLKNISFKVP